MPFPNIARHEPTSFRNRFLRLLLILKIPLKHRGPSNPNLALRMRLVRSIIPRVWEVHQFDLNSRGDVAACFACPAEGVAQRSLTIFMLVMKGKGEE